MERHRLIYIIWFIAANWLLSFAAIDFAPNRIILLLYFKPTNLHIPVIIPLSSVRLGKDNQEKVLRIKKKMCPKYRFLVILIFIYIYICTFVCISLIDRLRNEYVTPCFPRGVNFERHSSHSKSMRIRCSWDSYVSGIRVTSSTRV